MDYYIDKYGRYHAEKLKPSNIWDHMLDHIVQRFDNAEPNIETAWKDLSNGDTLLIKMIYEESELFFSSGRTKKIKVLKRINITILRQYIVIYSKSIDINDANKEKYIQPIIDEAIADAAYEFRQRYGYFPLSYKKELKKMKPSHIKKVRGY